jgi:hypothetical protein
MSDTVPTKIHPVYLTRLKGFVDPRSHEESGRYYHYVVDDDEQMLSLIRSMYQDHGLWAVRAFSTDTKAYGPCVVVGQA